MGFCPKKIPAPQSHQQVKKTMAQRRLQARPSTVLLCCPGPQRKEEESPGQSLLQACSSYCDLDSQW